MHHTNYLLTYLAPFLRYGDLFVKTAIVIASLPAFIYIFTHNLAPKLKLTDQK